MKQSGSHLVRAALAVIGGSACLFDSAKAYPGLDTPSVYESFNQNTTGNLVNATARGYGLAGTYTALGTGASTAVQVVSGGLAFGSLSNGSGNSLQITANQATSATSTVFTGVSAVIEGGKSAGDIDLYFYDKVFCSYLIKYSAVSQFGSGTNWARSGLHVAGNSGVNSFQVYSDGYISSGGTNVTGKIQPGVSYQSPTATIAYGGADSPTNPGQSQALDDPLGKTYMLIGRFTQAGNSLSVNTTATWNSAANSIVIPNTEGANVNIALGQLVRGTGIAPDSIVIAITSSSTNTPATIYLSKPTTAAGAAGSAVEFVPILTDADTLGKRGNWTTTAAQITGITDPTWQGTSYLQPGMFVFGSGIPIGTTIVSVTNTTTITLSQTPTTATVSGTPGNLTFRSVKPITAVLYRPDRNYIEVDRIPYWPIPGSTPVRRLVPGQLVQGPGIAPDTFVTKVEEAPLVDHDNNSATPPIYVATSKVYISKNPTAVGTDVTSLTFFLRPGRSTLFALSEAQYTHFTTQMGGMLETDLDTAAVGTGTGQVTVKIEGPVQTTGSFEFGPGRRMEIVGLGGSSQAQTFKVDEIRYGMTFDSVTQPGAFETPTAANIVSDTFANAYPPDPASPGNVLNKEVFNSGFGWKAGYYQAEETATPPGAFSYYMDFISLTPTGGNCMFTTLRKANGSDQGIRRRVDPAVVNMDNNYTIEFDYRPFEGGSAAFSSFVDRIQIGADGASVTNAPNFGPNPGEGTNLTWLVGSVGGDDGATRPMPSANKWYFFDYDPANFIIRDNAKNYFMKDNMVDTGMLINPVGSTSAVFRFKIEVDSVNFVYHPTVSRLDASGNVVESFSAKNLRFRVRAKANSVFWGASKPAGDDRTFSLDSIKITPGISPPVDGFPAWVTANPGIPSGQQGRTADGDGDGRPNFLEFALNGNPASGNGDSNIKNSFIALPETVGGQTFTRYYPMLSLPVRNGISFPTTVTSGTAMASNTIDALTYRIQGSYNLTDWTSTAAPNVVQIIQPEVNYAANLGLPALQPGWTYKHFRLSGHTANQPKGFIRAVVDTTAP